MKKIFITVAVAFLLTSCFSVKKSATTEIIPLTPAKSIMNNEVDSMSYAFGLNVGNDFAGNLESFPGGKINKELLIKGFSQALRNDTSLWMTESFAQEYFNNYIVAEQNKERAALKEVGENFLNENKSKEGVKVTDSGLQYVVVEMGDGAKPAAESKVRVHYTGKTIDGNIFDSSVERGEPAEFFLNQVIRGWTEGVQLMSVGSKYRFFIPYDLAYGEQGIPQAGIGPFSPLVFDVELLDIIE